MALLDRSLCKHARATEMTDGAVPQPPGVSSAPPRRQRVGSRLPQLTRHQRAIVVVLLLAMWFYMWTAATSAPFVFSSAHSSDIYNLMTDAFLHGHTYLPLTPPAGLLHLATPYDPKQNLPYQAT